MDDIRKIFNIVNDINGIEVDQIKTKRHFKYNKIVEYDEQYFSSFEDFMLYLNKDISFLDELYISLVTEEQEHVDIEYDRYFHNWELTFNKSTKTIDSLIYNIRAVFKLNFIDFYKKWRWIVFSIFYLVQIILKYIFKISNKYTAFYAIFVLLILIINCFIECKPYINNNYFKRNKDNIVFYILGVITPYIIDFIIKLLK